MENLRIQNNELKNNLIESDNKLKKNEEKLLKLQKKLNDQLEEEKKEMERKSSKKLNPIKNSVILFGDEDNKDINNKDKNKDLDNIGDDNLYNLGEEEIVSLSNDNDSEKNNNNNNKDINTEQMIKNYKFVQEENKSLQEVIKDLKKQIKTMKSNQNGGENINNDNNIEKLNNIILEKDSKIYNLEEQIKEYQKKRDEIIIGKSDEDKDKQIEILINEINSMRKKILNDISYNNRITNFDEFIKNIEKINELNCEIIDPDIQDAFARLNELVDMILDKVKHPINNNNKKVIIFSAFADTADYIYKSIADTVLACGGSAFPTLIKI